MQGMTTSFTVRKSNLGDLAAVDGLLSASYPVLLAADYPPSVIVTAVPLISRANPALLSSGSYFVVEDGDGSIIGAGGWTEAAPPGGRRRPGIGHIRHVVTDHRQVRRGVGRALMEHVIADAENFGITQLECFSTLTAERFYEAFGFRTIRPITLSLRAGIEFQSIYMVRESR
ncbi:MAG: GNAT family N-acetyltransferase [Boseongicola sp.]|nr:GNAT family N-acetyltransferase [Boseongicola sp.]MDD9978169.1 GNAT family N-acetyltransferase [Boseongicola sp.]